MSSVTLLGTITIAGYGSSAGADGEVFNAGGNTFQLADGIDRNIGYFPEARAYSIDEFVSAIRPPIPNYSYILGVPITGFWWATASSNLNIYAGLGFFNYNSDGSVPSDVLGKISSILGENRRLVGSGFWPITATLHGINTSTVTHPCYRDLVGGYALDDRSIPDNPQIVATETKQVTIKYYRQNKLEQIPDLKSICWMVYKCDLIKGENYYLPIKDCVLGTLYISDSNVLNLLSSLPTESGRYPWNDLLPQSIPGLFSHWEYLSSIESAIPANSFVFTETRILRKIAANNDIWKNATFGDDINPDPIQDHPMFKVDRERAYQWHLAPVEEGIGTLVMDSARTMEIHAALNAALYAKNPTTGESRIANLGHLIEKSAAFLGYRPEPDGTLSHDKEKAKVRTVISKDNPVDPSKVGVNSFGEQGMVVRRLNNAFTGKEITANECVLVRDLPQLLAEYQDQINLALGLQESSAIHVETQNGTAQYQNQLQVLTELLNLSISNHDMIRSALVSVMVAQGQTSEIIAGMGLPSVTKTIPVEIDGKISDLPYQGIAAHRSISQEIAVCTQNVGIVAGQLL
jgi:hypothetical protein